jgi:hypothetical protein
MRTLPALRPRAGAQQITQVAPVSMAQHRGPGPGSLGAYFTGGSVQPALSNGGAAVGAGPGGTFMAPPVIHPGPGRLPVKADGSI